MMARSLRIALALVLRRVQDPPWLWMIGAGLAVLGPLRAAVGRWQHTESPPPPVAVVASDPNVVKADDGQLRQMKLELVQVRPFQIEKRAVGRIAFNEDRTTPVFMAYAGRMVRLLAGPGDDVHPGSPLAQIDTREP